MESLEGPEWDVVLSGTGLQQSLLALALSRSGKKILHVDKNDYYGGPEAALSLQEAEAWVEKVNDASQVSTFRNAILTKSDEEDGQASLGSSRAYSISLSPQLIFTRSNLLPALVSSRVHAQLEFLAVGSWWVFNHEPSGSGETKTPLGATPSGEFRRIPGGREDVFSDKSLDLRAIRPLMKFLKLAADAEAHHSILEDWASKPFSECLKFHFNMPLVLHAPLLALTSSQTPPSDTLTSYALPRIHRYLTSIGLFGPGFGLVLPKWGCLSEIAQVGCRASAVGGGVYVLKNGVETLRETAYPISEAGNDPKAVVEAVPPLTIRLQGGEELKAHWLVGSVEDLPQSVAVRECEEVQISHSITIVSSPLSPLFHLAAEGAPTPAATVVVFPSGSLATDGSVSAAEMPPVYLTIHSSDTGECPAGQCDLFCPELETEREINQRKSSILWTLHYTRLHHQVPPLKDQKLTKTSHVITLPSVPPGLVVDDVVLRTVRVVWDRIQGEDEECFMLFEEQRVLDDEVNALDEELER
ncbi:MAG: hypothetical protein Q9191_006142 [Dirinaria sp. TL-2023a]